MEGYEVGINSQLQFTEVYILCSTRGFEVN
jgi:hypothetical protein